MAGCQHTYAATITWTGNRGEGTSAYRGYSRDYVIGAAHKPSIAGSADPAFLGDVTRYNPEDLLVASLAGCHMLWYLHLCSVAGVRVLAYEDHASGTMREDADGSGRFTEATLRPRVVLARGSDADHALHLHAEAHHKCFIANSVHFPVNMLPETLIGD